MLSFPNAKINLGLNVVSCRQDGYHDIETVFLPVPALCDALEFVESDSVSLQIFGVQVGGYAEDNLIIKALRLLQKDFDLPNLRCYIKKNIPLGAGLGGGSADAAFMLKMLNKSYSLQISDENLEIYAAKLGADCPFFIRNKPVFAEGIGNVMTEVNISLTESYLFLVKPNIHVSTASAYKKIKPQRWDIPLAEAVKLPIENWKKCLLNDFEPTVFKLHPELAEIKQQMYKNGALYASMSGSGSTIYGIFPQQPDTEIFNKHFVFSCKL
ncbi:MAG: 4-(cytidine 5'-diphospho)-2-C-methyl-D-erythritol kinase [Prevotellaceae bacterium]|jgi:4-diphosphocytidyl-2-C-methyl-D-erythritol kinase|nr:4-(cytidine 5'-diphospho)-2-C-methyl-D-erythritol kinase [Prevotellaceae bacterium]